MVEWVIHTHHAQAIDRQLRMLMTWDPALRKYRIWRFETLNPLPLEATEGEARFEGGELVMEWSTTRARRARSEDPEGHQWFFAQHVRDVSPEEMKSPG